MPIPAAVLEAEKRANQFIGEGANPQSNDQPPENEPPQPSPQPAPPSPEEASWRSRYEALQGKYNAEVPRLNEQLRSAMERITALETTPPKPVEKPKLVTDAETQEYTPEFIDMVERAAEQRVATLLAERDAKLAELENQLKAVGQSAGFTARERYLQKLDELFPPKAEGQPPYWRVLNDPSNVAFYDWLAEPDPISGIVRMEGMSAADRALDVERVSRILRAFLREKGEQAPPAPSHPQSQPHNAQILPTPTTGSPVPTSAPNGKVWKRSEINALYDAERRGAYRGRGDEFRRLEADIFAAQAEGRIVDG